MNLIREAEKIGRANGRSAATWVFDGNTSRETYAAVLKGLENGDPAVYDAYREPTLSGEYADDYSESDLAFDLGLGSREDLDPDEWDEIADAYLQAASDSFWAAVESLARKMLA